MNWQSREWNYSWHSIALVSEVNLLLVYLLIILIHQTLQHQMLMSLVNHKLVKNWNCAWSTQSIMWDSRVQGSDAVSFNEWLLVFQKIMVTSSWRSSDPSQCCKTFTQQSVTIKIWILSKTTVSTSNLSRYWVLVFGRNYVSIFLIRTIEPLRWTMIAPADTWTIFIPKITLMHYHITNPLTALTLFMGSSRKAGNKRILVLYHNRVNGFTRWNWLVLNT
jgi:hypothetical protein